MAIAKAVHNYTCIVPIRFTRAVTGGTVVDAPDLDDRGHEMYHPGGLTRSNAHGPMVGIQVGETIRMRIIREDIEAGAQLFATSTDTGIVEVTRPAGGGPIPANGVFSLRGVADEANRPVIIQVRFGAADGPVIAELEPHIFRRREVRVLAHLVTIDGTPTNRTDAGLVNYFRDVNAIWRPAGINAVYEPLDTVHETIAGNQFRRRDGTMANLPDPLGPAGNYAAAGTVTTDLANRRWEEFSTLLQIHPANNTVNVYFVHAAPEFVGLTYDNDVARPDGYGIAMRDDGSALVMAHELGHFLNIDRHANENNAGNSIRQDMWIFRRVMCGPWPPAAPAWRHDVSYGPGDPGAMITLKDYTQEQQDNETLRAIRRARAPY